MTEKLAKMELIVGNFEACKKAAKEALDRGTTTEMKINSLLVDVEARMTAFELDGAVTAAFNALQRTLQSRCRERYRLFTLHGS
jgi:hypothetical protein